MPATAREIDPPDWCPQERCSQYDIAAGALTSLSRIELVSMSLEVMLDSDAMWLFVRRAGRGGYAARTPISRTLARVAMGATCQAVRSDRSDAIRRSRPASVKAQR